MKKQNQSSKTQQTLSIKASKGTSKTKANAAPSSGGNGDPKRQKMNNSGSSSRANGVTTPPNTVDPDDPDLDPTMVDTAKEGANTTTTTTTTSATTDAAKPPAATGTTDTPEENITVQRLRKGGEWTLVTRKYKKLKSDSDNRRGNARLEEKLTARRRDGTPDRGNKFNFKYKTRITVKMNIQNDVENPYGPVINAFQELLQQINNVSDGSALLPWKEGLRYKGKIDIKSTFPSSWEKLKPYVHSRFYVPKRASSTIDVYPQFYIGHNIRMDDIKKQLKEWMYDAKRQIYRNILQAEDPTEVGFLLYSTREMDAGALADEISAAVGFPVGLRWKIIDSGKKGMKKSQLIKGLVVEVSASKKFEYQRALRKLYSSTTHSTDKYPNFVRLRFVISYADGKNIQEKSKVEKLRQRQKRFLATIRSTTSYSLTDLDCDYVSELPSLREMIMSIRVHNNQDIPLFHNVDLDYQCTGHIFQYSEENAAEAECAINTLIPYLTYLYPDLKDNEDEFFDEDAIDRCEGLIFDPKVGMVVDPNAGRIDGVELDIDDDLAGFDFTNNAKDEEDDEANDEGITRPKPAGKKKVTGPSDEDSVSTFGGSIKTSANKSTTINLVSPGRPNNGPKSQKFDNVDDDDASSMSAGTMHTMKTIKTLREENDKQFAQINEDNQLMRAQLHRLMEMLSTKPQGQQNPPSVTSGTQADSPAPPNVDAGSTQGSASGRES